MSFDSKKNEFDKLSNDEFAALLLEKYPDKVIEKIFELYSVNCMNLCKMEYRKLDALIQQLQHSSRNKASVIVEIITLVRSVSNGLSAEFPIVERVKQYVEEHVDSDCSVREIADNFGISLYYMLHQFKISTGMTISEYKNDYKLKKSKSLLTETEMSIAEIAQKCGYSNSSYFAKLFRRKLHISPTAYRNLLRDEQYKTTQQFKEAKDVDIIFYHMLPHQKLLDDSIILAELQKDESIPCYEVVFPNDDFSFLHESAIIAYHGELFAAWYNCPKTELSGNTPIRFTRSADNGKTWSPIKTVAEDPTGKIMYCPPVFGICDDTLYLFLNEMTSADCIHALDLYAYNPRTQTFDFLWSRPLPFKLNTNVCILPNGKLMLPGRMGEIDGFPTTPAALVSDSGKIDAPWRMVKIRHNGLLPDGSKQIYPELSAIIDAETIYMFSRNDIYKVPLLYISRDHGETWEGPIAHDIPIYPSKAYSGSLSDGRHYLIGNIFLGRQRLVLFISEPGSMKFAKAILLQDGFSTILGYGKQWHYPSAYEYDRKLYIIYTVTLEDGVKRGAVLSVIDLSAI